MTRTRIPALCATLGAAAYAGVLLSANSWVAGGSDSSGYLNAARHLARGNVREEIAPLPLLGLPASDGHMFVPLGYRHGSRPGTMAPSYPPGLPLHMAALGAIGGWSAAPFLAGPIAALAALVLIYGVARELGLSRGLSAAGVLMLAVCPVFFGLAIQPMSDVPATAWLLAAVYFALRARRASGWAFAAGAALGAAVLVRPTNLLGAAAVLFALPRRRDAIVRAVAGGIPFALFFFLYNHAAFGSAISSGYDATRTLEFSTANFLPQVRNFGFWLTVLLTPLLPLAWLGVGLDRRVPGRDRALIFAWFGAFFALYSFHEVFTDWWSVRYLLPGIPAMVLASLFVARDLPGSVPARRSLAAAALAAIVATGVVHVIRYGLLAMARGEIQYRYASRGAAGVVPERSLIAAMQMSGSLKYYAGRPILRWDSVPAGRFADLRRRASAGGVELYALLWPFEVADFRARLPGEWEPVGRWSDVILYRLR